MSKLAIVGLLVFLSLRTEALAGDTDLVALPSGPAVWTVDVTYEGAPPTASAGPGRIVKIDVVQDGKMRRCLVTYSSGKVTERWDIPRFNLILSEDRAGTAFAILDGGNTGRLLTIPYFKSSFEWLKPEYLTSDKPVPYHGKQCFHYEMKMPPSPSDPSSQVVEAWIDSTTLQPISLSYGKMVGNYTYSTAPPPELSLPPKFQDVYTRFQEGMGILKPVKTAQ